MEKDGIIFYENNYSEYIIVEIKELSEKLKEYIKNELTVICHGKFVLTEYDSKLYSLAETLSELIKRLKLDDNTKTAENKRVGFIGELLINIIIRKFTPYDIVSPFFNMEERNSKKGFDIISIFKTKENLNELWLIESKAGANSEEIDVTKKIINKINIAKNDLNKRLNESNSQLWLNANNSIRVALDSDDQKKTVLNLLKSISTTNKSNDKNVILAATFFSNFNTFLCKKEVYKKYNDIYKEKIFSKLKIIAIHKKTYQKIIEYIKELSNINLIGENL
ncbi:DUF1837 domain-containing protein [Fusobacterium nucleatum]|uniref:hypothetical protein n=1 Tax=Fusobacterium nucleatum TaxID=851 RepID=UPI0030CEA24E